MNITDCISNLRQFVIAILKRTPCLPDMLYLRMRYYLENGQKLHLSNAITFQEKIQWLKINRRKPEFTTMVDKYAVKAYVASKIGSEYIIPTLGVWNSFDEIDFNRLPYSFVLKTTHGGGNGGVVICRTKKTFNKDEARKKINASLKECIYDSLREWPYKNVPHRIIAEELITDSAKQDLTDYKVFCFNGEPRYIQVIQDRNTKETIDFFDTEWNHQEFYGLNPVSGPEIKPSTCKIARPYNLSKMLEIAEILSKGTDFLRVDLYNVNGHIYFGELTFFPASGFGTFTPAEWNVRLGNMMKIC